MEVYHDNSWVKICNSNNWGDEEANLVCRELGCGNAKKTQQSFNFGESGLKGYTNRCSGNISSIGQCTLKENTARCETVSLSCSGKKQMIGG